MTDHGDTTANATNEQQQQRQERIQNEERMSMDATDMQEAIKQEQDQKFDADDASRYQGDVDVALSGDEA